MIAKQLISNFNPEFIAGQPVPVAGEIKKNKAAKKVKETSSPLFEKKVDYNKIRTKFSDLENKLLGSELSLKELHKIDAELSDMLVKLISAPNDMKADCLALVGLCYFKMALVHQDNNDNKQAKQCIDAAYNFFASALNVYPGSFRGNCYMSIFMSAIGHEKTAFAFAEKAVPRNIEEMADLMDIYGDNDLRYLERFKEYISRNPKEVQAYEGLIGSYFIAAGKAIKNDKKAEALRLYKEAAGFAETLIKLKPDEQSKGLKEQLIRNIKALEK